MPSLTIESKVHARLDLRSTFFTLKPDFYQYGQIQQIPPESDVHRINQGDTNVDVYLTTVVDLTGFTGKASAVVTKPSGQQVSFLCDVTDIVNGVIHFNTGANVNQGQLFNEEGQYIVNACLDYLNGKKLAGDPAIIQVMSPLRLQFP